MREVIVNANVVHAPYRRWVGLAVFLAIAFAVAWAGSAVTLPKIPGWYASLNKPPFNPPSWIFGPVWSVLYTLMSVAAWRVWQFGSEPVRRRALGWYFVQLALNAIWSPVFFGMEKPVLALVIIALLLAAIAVTVMRFFKADRIAGWLLVPYLAWVSFATLLNASIAALN
jgi:tryptophan-rich sensory protein